MREIDNDECDPLYIVSVYVSRSKSVKDGAVRPTRR